jgi:hypothetical protein
MNAAKGYSQALAFSKCVRGRTSRRYDRTIPRAA